ncbi:hypothetical protein ACIQU1_08310 [Streptomyces angustmyceticus]|uniref:hypothetical protein n=1 Tax=Streptomyces angustmyceticus TaxID=285578 RepID=UPI00344DEC41
MRRAAFLALGAAMLLSAGCSGAVEGEPQYQAEDAAAESAGHEKAVRAAVAATSRDAARLDEKITLGGRGETYSLAVRGRFDLARHTGRLTVNLPGGAVDQVEEIFTGGTVYLRGVPAAAGKWAAIDRDDTETHYLLRSPVNDPEHLLRQVAAMRYVAKAGEEKIDGVTAVHYRGVLDYSTITLRMSPETRTKAAQMRESLGGTFPVHADAWVDGRQRLVRARLSFGNAGIEVTNTLTLSAPGAPVEADAPAARGVVRTRTVSGVLLG